MRNRTITVGSNQGLLDIALQEFGDVRAGFDIALLNGLSLSDPLYAGQRLLMPQSPYQQRDIQAYYRAKGIRPATAPETSPTDGLKT